MRTSCKSRVGVFNYLKFEGIRERDDKHGDQPIRKERGFNVSTRQITPVVARFEPLKQTNEHNGEHRFAGAGKPIPGGKGTMQVVGDVKCSARS